MTILNVQTEGFANAEQLIADQPKRIDRARERALRKTSKWGASQFAGRVAKSSRVPKRLLMKGGGTSGRGKRVFFATKNVRGGDALIWVGMNPIRAAYIGKLRETKKGARAGQHKFNGAFVATMKSGHRGVFRRKYQSRLPIVEETVDLTMPTPIPLFMSEVTDRFKVVMRQELHYEATKLGRA